MCDGAVDSVPLFTDLLYIHLEVGHYCDLVSELVHRLFSVEMEDKAA